LLTNFEIDFIIKKEINR